MKNATKIIVWKMQRKLQYGIIGMRATQFKALVLNKNKKKEKKKNKKKKRRKLKNGEMR